MLKKDFYLTYRMDGKLYHTPELYNPVQAVVQKVILEEDGATNVQIVGKSYMPKIDTER